MKICDIKYLLGQKGMKFVEIDKQFCLREGVTRFAVSKPHKAGEEALSSALNIPLKELFPDRYNDEGKRLTPQPSVNYAFKKIN